MEDQIKNVSNIPFRYVWCKNFKISTSFEDNIFKIKANKEGLESLGKQLLQLSQENISAGFHLHYDDYNCLENESISFIIEKE